jgi:flavin-dependent dehydrogenase
MSVPSFDLAVLGAGIAGLTVALATARRGLRVVLVDREPAGSSGAHWINGLVAERAAASGVALPETLFFHRGGRFVGACPMDRARQVVDPVPQDEIDMHALLRWLEARCDDAGVVRRQGRVADDALDRTGPACTRIALEAQDLQAAVVVDARGVDAAWIRSQAGQVDLCSAWQGVLQVEDPAAARAWWSELGLAPFDTWSRAGVEGGWSVCNLSLSADGVTLAMLTGALHQPRFRSGARIAEDARAALPFATRVLRSGGGLIPLQTPLQPPVEDGMVRVGDRGGFVFPLHGSGVQAAFEVAALLAPVLHDAVTRGDTGARALWPFATTWHRGPGATHAWYQGLRVMASTLNDEDHRTLLASGLSNPRAIARALAQRPPAATLPSPMGMVREVAGLRTLLPRVLRCIQLGTRLSLHHRRFPQDPAGWHAWHARERDLRGPLLRLTHGRG